ncbi:MAG: NTP transferase domain-containing protein [Proteobacteria bacterium]|nr:NTP transferase domain-containing protein [Pseudomonadota bacterium]
MIPQNFVLLAAGRGSRLAQLTTQTHKALLPIAGKPALQYLLDHLMILKKHDIVVVTGYRSDDINLFLKAKYGNAIKTVFNQRYESDTNILSVDLGIDALLCRDAGYMIIETDIILEPAGWQCLIGPRQSSISEWATIGKYSTNLTGAALKTDETGRVTDIVYAPKYDKQFDGWKKLLGTLYVGANEVALDIAVRKEAIQRSIAQFYLMPWIENINKFPCQELDLSNYYAASFNDIEAYKKADKGYERAVQREKE